MQTFYGDIDIAFTFLSCCNLIALYDLPYLHNQKEHYHFVNWQNLYRATDILWLNSLSDRFTGNQLVNPHSALNTIGRDIAKEMEQNSGIPCYYNVFDDLTKRVKFAKSGGKTVRICPSCGNAMNLVEFCDNYRRYVCEECKLSSDVMKDSPI